MAKRNTAPIFSFFTLRSGGCCWVIGDPFVPCVEGSTIECTYKAQCLC
jgi:hypothetical protein